MANPEDVARMPCVLKNFDSVELLKNKDGNVEISKIYTNSKGEPAPSIRYHKRINGHYYVVEAIPDSNAKRLRVVSTYTTKKEVWQEPNAFAPGTTSKTNLAITSKDQQKLPVNGLQLPEMVAKQILNIICTKAAKNIMGFGCFLPAGTKPLQ